MSRCELVFIGLVTQQGYWCMDVTQTISVVLTENTYTNAFKLGCSFTKYTNNSEDGVLEIVNIEEALEVMNDLAVYNKNILDEHDKDFRVVFRIVKI